MATRREKLVALICDRPGLTEKELAKAMHGGGAVQQYVNADCRAVAKEGLIERRGLGGVNDPYRYFLVIGQSLSQALKPKLPALEMPPQLRSGGTTD